MSLSSYQLACVRLKNVWHGTKRMNGLFRFYEAGFHPLACRVS